MKIQQYLLLIFVAYISAVSCKRKSTGNIPELKNSVDSLSYFTGIFTGNTMKNLDDTVFNPDIFYQAVKEVFKQKEFKMGKLEADYNIGKYFDKLHEKEEEKNLKQGKEFLSKNSIRNGVITTPSGLQYEVIREGAGAKPKINEKVLVKYSGSLINGKEFANTFTLNRVDTLYFRKNEIMPGFFEALKIMKAGSRYKIYLPASLAFGNNPPPLDGLKPNMVVIFDIEIISII